MNTKRLILILMALLVLSLAACESRDEPVVEEVQANPFYIGQVVYPGPDFDVTHSQKEIEVAQRGAKVLDITNRLVRVRYTDDSVEILSFVWFEYPENPVEIRLTDDWLMGNPFHEGATVCLVPDSRRKGLPNEGTIEKVNGEVVLLDTYTDWLNWEHLQYCP